MQATKKRVHQKAKKKPQVALLTGKGGGVPEAIVTGEVVVVSSGQEAKTLVKDGNILVTAMTDVDYVPAMERAAAVVTNFGGIICHAAVVCAELGVPFIVGTANATQKLKTGDMVTVNVKTGEVLVDG